MKEYIVQAIIQETIDSFDAHNAPELIRCKDCKHVCGKEHGMYCPFIECEITGAFHKEDWFCADAKRI